MSLVVLGATAAGVAAAVARGAGALNGNTHSGTTGSLARVLPAARCVDAGGVAVEQAVSIAEATDATIEARAIDARAVGTLMAPPPSIRSGRASTRTA